MKVMWSTWLPAISMALLASAATADAKQSGATGEAALAARLRGLVPGPARACVSARQLRESDIVDGVAIVYRGGGSRRYVNRPHGALGQLRSDYIIVTRTPSTQLCEGEPFDLVSRAERQPVASLTLGPFEPFDRPAKR